MATRREIEANAKFTASGTDSTRQEIEKIRNAAEDLGEDGKKAAQKLVDGFSNIEKGADRVEKKISQGRAVTSRDVGAMVQSYEHLKDSINQSFGSLEKAPVEIQKAFAKAEAQMKRTTSTVRDLSDATSDHSNTLAEAGQKWGGLGSAIQDAAGPMGAMVGKIGLYTAAFKEGWQIGVKFNEFIGTDMTLMNEMVGVVAARMGAVIRQLSDQVVAVAKLTTSLFSGSTTEIKKAWEEAQATGAKFADTIKGKYDILKPSAESLAAAQRKVAEETAAAKAAADLAAEAYKKFEAEQKKLEESARRATEQLADQSAKLDELNVKAGLHNEKVAQTGEIYHASSVALNLYAGQLTEAKEELAKLSATTNESSLVYQQQAEKVAALTALHDAAKGKLDNESAAYTRLNEEGKSLQETINREGKAWEEKKTKQIAASVAAAAHLEQQRAATTQIDDFITINGKLIKVTDDVAAANTKAAPIQAAATTATKGMATAADEAAIAMGKISAAQKSLSIDEFKLYVDSFVNEVDRMVTAANKATDAIKGLGNAHLDGGDEVTH